MGLPVDVDIHISSILDPVPDRAKVVEWFWSEKEEVGSIGCQERTKGDKQIQLRPYWDLTGNWHEPRHTIAHWKCFGSPDIYVE